MVHSQALSARMSDPNWWRQAAIYQIYPRSFADGNGDGIGDLGGVLSRIDYLASLNLDAVWFSPFYPSALVDGGYDIDDYRDISPVIGTLGEFDEVIEALHSHGIKVIIDIVPNHSSNRHARFLAALAAAAGSPERDYYIFRDGEGEHGELPPSDWQSLFGGPAWTRVTEPDGSPGQWYLHLFTAAQPDWNWTNPAVRTEFLETLAFWGDRGVDGFRVDVAMALAKDMSEPYPAWADIASAATPGSVPKWPEGQHPISDRDELTDIYAGWREVFNRYDPPLFAVAEAWVAPHRRARYASPQGLGQAFSFDLLAAPWSAQTFTEIIGTNLTLAADSGSTSTWVFANHDVVRQASRYAQQDLHAELDSFSVTQVDADSQARGLARARAATLLVLALPGSTYLYQGEELGLPQVLDIPAEFAQDPLAKIENGVEVAGRDGCRVPLPWATGGEYFGFSDGASHLPQPDWFGSYSVQAETADPGSTLELYRAALELRARLQTSEELEWLELGDDVIAFRRPNGWTSVTNFGDASIDLPAGDVLLRTESTTDDGQIASESTVWLLA
jgi:alpha-glucosidase